MFCVKNNCVLVILVKQSKKTWLQNIFDILGWQKTTKLRIFVRRLIHNKIFKTLAWGRFHLAHVCYVRVRSGYAQIFQV